MLFDQIITHFTPVVGALVLGGAMAFNLWQTPTPRMRKRRSIRFAHR